MNKKFTKEEMHGQYGIPFFFNNINYTSFPKIKKTNNIKNTNKLKSNRPIIQGFNFCILFCSFSSSKQDANMDKDNGANPIVIPVNIVAIIDIHIHNFIFGLFSFITLIFLMTLLCPCFTNVHYFL